VCCRRYTSRRWCTDGNRPVVGFVLPAPLPARHLMHSAQRRSAAQRRRRNGPLLIHLFHMLHLILLIQLADIATRLGTYLVGLAVDTMLDVAKPSLPKRPARTLRIAPRLLWSRSCSVSP
jgi:hypothetical protein